MKPSYAAALALSIIVTGCASTTGQDVADQAVAVMKASFLERGQAKLDRLDQDEAQKLCSLPPSASIPKETADRIEAINLASVKYPADGKLLGNWREGEKVAQSGIGKQYSDDPTKPSGANCYACHQLSKEEISFGTIGPSLYHFGKVRGNSEAIQRYAYGKVYNSQAYTACSNMPRFGHKGILTEQQIKDVTALLLDPESPVNK
jgi:L-cysteine S-thiosulfotransferase